MIEFPDIKMCPKCGDTDELKIVDSRNDVYGVKRRRACSICGHRFNTLEIHEDVFNQLVTAYEKVRSLESDMGELQKLKEMRDLWDSFTRIGRSL